MNPPPNPAKSTDSRFEEYRRLHGEESWELDALDPSILNGLITNTILEYREESEYTLRHEEERHRADLAKASKHWNGKLAQTLAKLT